MFCRRGSKGFISNESEIVAPRELGDPIIHRAYDGMDAESSIAQHLADTLSSELNGSIWIAPCYLQVERNKTIAWIPREQNDLCAAKLSSRYQIFASQPVPEIAFGPVLEQIVRKYQPRNSWLAVTFRPQRELKAEALAKVRANKRTKPGAAAFRDRNDNGDSSGKLTRTAAEIAACPS